MTIATPRASSSSMRCGCESSPRGGGRRGFEGRRVGRRDYVMKVFWSDIQQQHSPKFFLQRGKLRQNFEVPARAEALPAAVKSRGLDIVEPPPVARAVLETIHAP